MIYNCSVNVIASLIIYKFRVEKGIRLTKFGVTYIIQYTYTIMQIKALILLRHFMDGHYITKFKHPSKLHIIGKEIL